MCRYARRSPEKTLRFPRDNVEKIGVRVIFQDRSGIQSGSMAITRRSWLIGAASALAAQTSAQPKPIRVGFIGVGARGTELLRNLLAHPGVAVPVLCDINPANLKRAQDLVTKERGSNPEGFSRGPD